MEKVDVKIRLMTDGAKIPTYAKDGDAGADVYVVDNPVSYSQQVAMACARSKDVNGEYTQFKPGDYILQGGETILVSLGFQMELPRGWEMQVRSRSGLSKRGIVVANSPGTIDSGYRGLCMVMLRNENPTPRILKPYTRVAQFVLKRAPQANFSEAETLSSTDRGDGGFGSTGTK